MYKINCFVTALILLRNAIFMDVVGYQFFQFHVCKLSLVEFYSAARPCMCRVDLCMMPSSIFRSGVFCVDLSHD